MYSDLKVLIEDNLLDWCEYCCGVNSSFSVILSSAINFSSTSSGSPFSSTRFKVELREGPNSAYLLNTTNKII